MLGNFGSAIMGAKYRFALQWERGTSFEMLWRARVWGSQEGCQGPSRPSGRAGLLEPPERPQGSPVSSSVWQFFRRYLFLWLHWVLGNIADL